jgi:hypothetical protein
MTFLKPYSGTFAYKGILPSAAMNIINDAIPLALDKTGDWSGIGGGVIGAIEWLSGSELILDSGSTLTLSGTLLSNLTFDSSLTSPTILQATRATDVAPGNMLITSGDAYPSAVTHVNGGNLTIGTGNKATGSGQAGDLFLVMGNGGSTTPVLSANALTTTLVGNNATVLTIGSAGFTANMPLMFAASTAAPGVTINSTTSGSGTNLVLSAQTTSASGYNGGNIVMSSGNGPAGAVGNIQLELGGTLTAALSNVSFYTFLGGVSNTGTAFSVSNYLGAVNTQLGIYNVAQYFASSNAVSVNIASYTIATSTGAMFEVAWVRRATTSVSIAGNKMLVICVADGSGNVTGTSAVNTALYVDTTGTFAPASNIGIVYSTNLVTFSVAGLTAPVDWQVTITASQI